MSKDAHADKMLPEGFPLPGRERNVLENCDGAPGARPKGSGGATLANLIGRGWIVRNERLQDYGSELYAITPLGKIALGYDGRVLDAGFPRPRPGAWAPGAAAYKDPADNYTRFKAENPRL